MIADIRTVMWKEFNEILYVRGNKIGLLFAMIIPALLFGVIFPLQFGSQWTEAPVSIIVWVIVPFILISAVIADSFAGERERHTLETLLASRLSEKSILLGKLFAVILYALSVTVIIIVLGLITLNISNGLDGILIFPPKIWLVGVLTGFFVASIVSNFGTLVSLRASTVRQAQQTLGITMFVLIFSPSFIFEFLPESFKDIIQDYLGAYDLYVTIAIIAGILLAVDVFLFIWALRRFKRELMMLD
ncbi:ABC transporter permease [Candidatus Latescibacterota bacterium]